MIQEEVFVAPVLPLDTVEMASFELTYAHVLSMLEKHFMSLHKQLFKVGDRVYVDYMYYKDGMARKINNDFKLRDVKNSYRISNLHFNISSIENLLHDNEPLVWRVILNKYILLKKENTVDFSQVYNILLSEVIEKLKMYHYRVGYVYNLEYCYGEAVPQMALIKNDEAVVKAYLEYIETEEEIEKAKSKMAAAQLNFIRAQNKDNAS